MPLLPLFHAPAIKIIRQLRSGNGFQFTKLERGNYLVVVSYRGYVSDSTAFSINAKDSVPVELKIFLNPDVNSLLQVVVRASIPPPL
ncbi:MAG: hypothetical protein WDM78_13885 [Puia sp.]